MQSNATAKIKSERRKLIAVAIAAAILLFFAFSFFATSSVVSLVLGQKVYYLQTARTEAQREKGLGNRNNMPSNEGMLFIYGNMGKRCFWMKDMSFSLDMIWVDNGKHITHIEHNVTPDTYPDKTFCAFAQDVIELPAGVADQYHLALGQTLTF